MTNDITINTNFLLSQLIAQISDLGKAVNLGQDFGLISEIAKVVYPLIYGQNLERLKNLTQRDVDHLKKQIPKEFRIAINEMKAEHFSKKPYDIKEMPKGTFDKKPELQQTFTKTVQHPKFLQEEKGEKLNQKPNQKDIFEKTSEKISEKPSLEKPSSDKGIKNPIKDSQKKTLSQNNAPFKTSLKNEENRIFVKEPTPSFKEDNQVNKKPLTNAEKQEIVSKIKQTAQELKTLLSAKAEYAPIFKPKIPLTLPFVTFHPKKEKIEVRVSEKEKMKLKRVCEIEATGEDKKDKSNQN